MPIAHSSEKESVGKQQQKFAAAWGVQQRAGQPEQQFCAEQELDSVGAGMVWLSSVRSFHSLSLDVGCISYMIGQVYFYRGWICKL